MNNNEWQTEDHNEPWEQSYYQTGSTRPPKNRQGFLAVALVVVIFLGGILSVLGFLNIHLFRQDSNNPDEDASFRFSSEESVTVTEPSAAADTTPPTTGKEIHLELNQSPQSVENIPQTGGLSLQSIYEKAIPSVVSISCSASTGTGVILSADGYIVTNCHVVENATSVEVIFEDGSKHPARIVGTDTISDLAVLWVDAEDLTPAQFGDSSSLRVGDVAVAIGDPLGIELRGTMTDGIISAINRNVTTGGRTLTLIQTNAALNSGNSGGPLLNSYGQVIGINTMKIGAFTDSAGVEGLGFAIPSTTVKQIVDQLIAQGYVSGRPALGFTYRETSITERQFYRIPSGLLVTEILEGSDAAKKGLAVGDILIKLEGTDTPDQASLETVLYSHQPGDTLEAIIYRSGKYYRVPLTLGEATG